jgi:hypothetical protein
MTAAATLAARDRWAAAVWADDRLRPLERLVALAFADHAGSGLDAVWIAGSRLRQRTGLSRDAANRALRGLESAGWLAVAQPAQQHRSTRYALRVPASVTGDGTVTQASVTGDGTVTQASVTGDGTVTQASVTGDGTVTDASVPSPDASVPSPDASVPRDGTDYPSYLPTHHQRAARAALAAGVDPQLVDDVAAAAVADPATVDAAARIAKDGRYRAGLVAKASADRTSTLAERIRQLRQGPDCPHGDPGGQAPHPTSGHALCPQCRRSGVRAAS